MGELFIEHEDGKEFIVNSDMTNAVMENVQDYLKFQKTLEEAGGDLLKAIFGERDSDKFYGTVVNEDVILKLEAANKYLDVIGTMDNVETEKFSDPNPNCREAIVAITVHNGRALFKGTVYGSLRRIAELADEMSVIPRGIYDTRIVFIFKNLWSDYREMTDAELEDQREKYGLNDEGKNKND